MVLLISFNESGKYVNTVVLDGEKKRKKELLKSVCKMSDIHNERMVLMLTVIMVS